MGNWEWKGMMEKKEEQVMIDLILYLFEGFKKYGDDKYADHIIYIAVRDVTRIIGERKNLYISEKAEGILGDCIDIFTVEAAQKAHPYKTVKEHKIPAKTFWEEFKTKRTKGQDFTRADAERWLRDATIAIITKEEDDELTHKKWGKVRPPNAYEELGIMLKKIIYPEKPNV